jgi:predicted peptidase
MKKYLLLWSVIWIINSSNVMAQSNEEIQDQFQAHTFKVEGTSLNYRLFSPETKQGEKYPIILFMHGAGERGNDNERQLTHGVWNFAKNEIQKTNPAFIVAPQVPEGQRWSVIEWWGGVSQTWEDSMNVVLRHTDLLLEKLLKELPIDSSRVYVTGLSMGGFGTWEYIQRYPEKVAAAVPVCGGGDLSKAERISGIPIWAFHGALDDVVLPQFSRQMVDSLRTVGNKVGYTEYPDVAHNSWVRAYEDLNMISWMFSQQK